MKLQLLKVTKGTGQSFSARRDVLPDVNYRWHYHTELELIYFKKGEGTQFVGNSIQPFVAGDIVLVGSNLPHFFRFDDQYFEGENKVDVVVIHFLGNFWGDAFLDLPENVAIKTLIEQAKLGIHLSGIENEKLGEMMQQIVPADGPRRIMLLMDVLLAMGNRKEKVSLNSFDIQQNIHRSAKDKIDAVYNYSIANFKNKIRIEDVAAIANVSPNSFCKYFRLRSNKTYSQFINEIRVGYACKLLVDDKLNMKEVCYESGFYNFSSFHKYFKQITGKSPLNYQKYFTNKV